MSSLKRVPERKRGSSESDTKVFSIQQHQLDLVEFGNTTHHLAGNEIKELSSRAESPSFASYSSDAPNGPGFNPTLREANRPKKGVPTHNSGLGPRIGSNLFEM